MGPQPRGERPRSHELRIVAMMAEGKSAQQIAHREQESYNTIKSRIATLYRRWGAVSAAHAVGLAYRKEYLLLDALEPVQVNPNRMLLDQLELRDVRIAALQQRCAQYSMAALRARVRIEELESELEQVKGQGNRSRDSGGAVPDQPGP